ncbi:MAG: hypothetical protein GY801_24555 [bacterium]|nr:hypothetical protein [bacterium]
MYRLRYLGLVCGLCAYLVENVVTDRTQAVTMADLYPALKYFLTQRFDKNILNIVQKAHEKRDFMLRLLFSDTPIEFSVDIPDIAYLYAHGVIDNIDGYVGLPVPLYSKRLITAFRPCSTVKSNTTRRPATTSRSMSRRKV